MTYSTTANCINTRQGYHSSMASATRSAPSLPPMNLSASRMDAIATSMREPHALPPLPTRRSSRAPGQKLDSSTVLSAALSIARGEQDDILSGASRNNAPYVRRQ